MAITVKHKFVSAIPDAGDPTIVQPSNWNDSHDLVGTVPVANGGTGAATLTGYVKGTGTTAMTAASTIPNTDITGLGTASTKDAGVALGVATLDGSGTVPISQLPAAVLGALSYQGTWNASTNSPTLTSSVGTKGYYYVVNVAGSTNLDGITDWKVGDWAVYNGTAWQKVDNTDAVTSVNGYTGTVVLTNTDITGFGTMSTQNANAVAITGGTIDGTTIGATTTSTGKFTTLNASTSLTTPIVQASNSGGLSLKNSAGTTQISMGAGGGDNASINVSTNMNGTNAQIDISPTGTGHVHINPTGVNSIQIAPTYVGTMDNMTIGATTPKNGSFVDLSVTGAVSFDTLQGTVGQVLTSAGTGNTPTWTTPTTGTVTSVTGTSPVVSSGGNTPAISLAANYGDTQNPYASKTLKYFLAAPNAADGAPTFRAMLASDVPTLNQSTTGSAATLTTPRNIYGNAFDGSAALTQIIASTYGGTGNGFTKFSGATTAEKTYTLPDANATLLYAGGALGTPSSGTVTNLTGTASININGTVGATTATTGAFSTISATGVITSTLATGTAPFTVASTTQVANLNAATAGTAGNVTGIVLGANGGTGVANTGKTITLGGNLTTSGAFATTLTSTATTALTLPISGTVISTVNNMANNPVTGTPSASNYLRGDGTWSSIGATYTRTSFTATVGQTTFSATYTAGYLQVYQNGVMLNSTDYTASNGTSVVLAIGAATGDIIETIAYATTTALTPAGSDTQVQYNNAGTLAGSANMTFDGTTLTAAKLAATASVTASGNKGAISYGTLGYSDTNILASYASSVAGYNQVVLQNTSNNAAASTNFNISNDAGTATTNYGEFGINSSAFSGTGSFSTAGSVYLASASTDLAIGTYGANAVHFVVNSGATDAGSISSAGRWAINNASANTTSTALLHLGAGTATASTAPLKLTSGTNLTSAEVGAIEYDGNNLYVTTDTTQGRGVIESVQQFYLSAAGGTLSGATQNFFGSNSAASLAATSTYDIEAYCYFLKTTAGTVQWIPTFSSAITVGHCALEYTPVTGFTTSVITGAMVTAEATQQTTTTLTNTATASLSSAVYHVHKLRIRVTTNLACNFRLNNTIGTGSITPQAGSWYTVRKVVTNAGNFVA